LKIEITAVRIPAKYEDGVFKPLEDVRLADGTRVVEVYVPAEAPRERPRSIRDKPFFGIWADRDDITDGVRYVNALRNNRRG
jgi:predicted DNA-binding antitoxin AbrB/MazE fold protein